MTLLIRLWWVTSPLNDRESAKRSAFGSPLNLCPRGYKPGHDDRNESQGSRVHGHDIGGGDVLSCSGERSMNLRATRTAPPVSGL